jgi:radical SAM protein with 4Fe4S-binding SPASM domain
MSDTERWLTDGDCSKCRRKEYCGTECTASKRRTRAELLRLIREKIGGDIIDRVLENSGS